ncbi:MAG TPA: PIG-L family deacetylase [Polyangiaceae bacterium]|nr:PIG-L family deacetylase [Polyangiaceae bacterium]
MSCRHALLNIAFASLCWHAPARAQAPSPAPAAALEVRSGGLVVVAPHPDDEALIAGGAIARAVASGQPVAVLILTSGDYACRSAASQRQAESIAGLEALGVKEDQVFFLGYPDGYLSRLGVAPLPAVPRLIAGTCVHGNTTYGQRGAGRADVHTLRTGAPAVYTAPNLLADLGDLLERLAPRTLIVTHPADSHADHAAAYALVRRASSGLRRAPRLLRALVHGDDCWPTGGVPGQDCTPGRIAPREAMPPPTGALRGYLPNLRLAVPKDCLLADPPRNPKLSAISAHHSQTHGSTSSYLFAFARRDEAFFSEDLSRNARGVWAPRVDPHADGAPTFLLRGHEHFSIEQSLPLALGVALQRPRPGKPVRVSLLGSSKGHYALDFDGETLEVSLSKHTEMGLELVKKWPLPHDAWALSEQTEHFELQVTGDPSSASAAALTLLRNDVVVGVATDPAPLRRGNALSADDPSGPRGAVSLSLCSSGSRRGCRR